METSITLNTPDNYIIEGNLNQKEPSDKLIIFVHGLGGHQNEHIFYNGAKFFNQQGFDTFRFDLYPGGKGRNLKDCGISTHAQDLNTVINHLNSKYSQIYLVGHSLGGPTIMLANTENIKKIILWDPVLNTPKLYKDEVSFDQEMNTYMVCRGTDIILGSKMIEEMKNIEDLNFKLDTRYKIIYTDGTDLKDDLTKEEISHLTLKNCSHCFNEEGMEDLLFAETLSWIN